MLTSTQPPRNPFHCQDNLTRTFPPLRMTYIRSIISIINSHCYSKYKPQNCRIRIVKASTAKVPHAATAAVWVLIKRSESQLWQFSRIQMRAESLPGFVRAKLHKQQSQLHTHPHNMYTRNTQHPQTYVPMYLRMYVHNHTNRYTTARCACMHVGRDF